MEVSSKEPATGLVETQARRRGHDFYPPASQRDRIPALYSTEDVEPADKVIWLKYFVAGASWLIAEVDWQTGVAFGWCDLGVGFPEWGYVSLQELEELSVNAGGWPLIVERDLYFTPTRFGDLDGDGGEV